MLCCVQYEPVNDDNSSTNISVSETETDGVDRAAEIVSEIEGGDTDNAESEVQVRSTKRPLKDSYSLSSNKKKREQEAEQQLLKSSIECMNRASESLINSQVGSAGDDITAF